MGTSRVKSKFSRNKEENTVERGKIRFYEPAIIELCSRDESFLRWYVQFIVL